jgi:hypothetical protein
MSSPVSEFADLDYFGTEARPERAFAPDLKTVPDGVYDCQFHELEWAHAEAARVLRCDMSIGGQRIRHTYWFNQQGPVNVFLSDMLALGLPAGTWGNRPGQTPLSQAIPAAVAGLRGVRFRATKTSRSDSRPEKRGTVYHDLVISARITGAAMPASRLLSAAPVNGPPPITADPQPAAQVAGKEEDIPF